MARAIIRLGRWSLAAAACLGAWAAADLAWPVHHDLRRFDGAKVGRLEADMWRAYYEHRPLRLFGQMHTLLGEQFGLPFWRAWLGAFRATRAAVVFQRGHNHADYLQALPDLERYYALIHRASVNPFDVPTAARLELEWWIVHRERASHSPGDLDRALAELQAAIYRQPADAFAEHARARAEAMRIRDTSADCGATTEADWRQIDALLQRSWISLEEAVSR